MADGEAGDPVMAAEILTPLVGCMTDAANDVNDQLSLIDMPPKVTRFLRHLERSTFGNAGRHRQWGSDAPGADCMFDLSAWVAFLKMPKSQIIHVRARLIDDRLIWYKPDPEMPGRGRIGWNLRFEEWRTNDPAHRQWGGKRAGAGRPKQQTSIDILNTEQDTVDILNKKSVSRYQRSYGSNIIEIATHASYEAAQVQGSAEALRMGTEEEIQTETSVSGADAVASDALPAVCASPMVSTEAASPEPSTDAPLLIAGDAIGNIDALQDDGTPPIPPKKSPQKSPRERKVTAAEQAYRGEIMQRVKALRHGAPFQNYNKEWGATRRFWRWCDGKPAELEQVVDCYRLTLAHPRYDTFSLSFTELPQFLEAYERLGPKGYEAGIARKRKAVNGGYETERAAQAAPRATKPPTDYDRPQVPRFKTVDGYTMAPAPSTPQGGPR